MDRLLNQEVCRYIFKIFWIMKYVGTFSRYSMFQLFSFLFPSPSLHNYSVPNLPHRSSPSSHACDSWHFLPHMMLIVGYLKAVLFSSTNFLYSVYLPQRILLDFPCITSLASLSFLRLWHQPQPPIFWNPLLGSIPGEYMTEWLPCHFHLVVIEQHDVSRFYCCPGGKQFYVVIKVILISTTTMLVWCLTKFMLTMNTNFDTALVMDKNSSMDIGFILDTGWILDSSFLESLEMLAC